jgi:hypothetical protein
VIVRFAPGAGSECRFAEITTSRETSNIEHRTLNVEVEAPGVQVAGRFMFARDVAECCRSEAAISDQFNR